MKWLLLALSLIALACAPAASQPTGRGAEPSGAPAAPAPAAPGATPAQAPLQRLPARIIISSPSVGFAYFDVARDLGIFEKYALDPEIIVLGGNAAVAALQGGEVDLLASTGTATRAAIRGIPVRVIQIAVNRASQFLLIGDKSISDLTQLRGKTVVGSGPGTTTNALIAEWLRRRGVEPHEYEVVNVNQSPPRAAMLTNGLVAAIGVEASTAVPLVKQGYPALATGAELEMPNGGLAASLDAIQNRRDLLRRASRVVLEATEVMRTRKDQTVAVFTQHYNLSPEDAAQVYDWMHSGWTADGRPSMAGVQFEFDLEQKALELTEPIPIERVYDFSILDEVRAGR
jgi:ABC-type nitrate/sulfonate/bicarbonate transport system substrate-binding protein